jgi:hypothetical protein
MPLVEFRTVFGLFAPSEIVADAAALRTEHARKLALKSVVTPPFFLFLPFIPETCLTRLSSVRIENVGTPVVISKYDLLAHRYRSRIGHEEVAVV